MQIFIDSANPKEIEKWLRYGIADGVTTNPTIMLKDGITDMEKGAKEIAAILDGKPISVEVITDNSEEMLSQAREFSSWAKNIVVKIPIISQYGEPCLEVINTLENEGIRVNATAALSFGQMALSAKAGATYSSIFSGRVGDEGADPWELGFYVSRMARELELQNQDHCRKHTKCHGYSKCCSGGCSYHYDPTPISHQMGRPQVFARYSKTIHGRRQKSL